MCSDIIVLILLFIGTLLVSFDLYYPINLVTFSRPPTRDTRNYQMLVICHARSNVTSLNLSLKKRSKHNKNITKLCYNCEITDKKVLVLKKKVITQQINHKAVLKLKIPIKKIISIFFRSTRIIRSSSSSSDMDLIILVLRKKY